MTNFGIKVDEITAGRIWRREQTAIVRNDHGVDFQKGDGVSFNGDSSWLGGPWRITHVLKNQNGVADQYAVLCIQEPDADHWERVARREADNADKLRRSNAALRGVITRMRKAAKR